MAKKNFFEQIFDISLPVNVINVGRYNENTVTIVLQDSERNDTFGNNDANLKAVNGIIEFMDFKFEFENDPYCFEKRMISIIDTVGSRIKHNCSYETDKSNIIIVKEFIEWFLCNNLHTHSEFINILDKKELPDHDDD